MIGGGKWEMLKKKKKEAPIFSIILLILVLVVVRPCSSINTQGMALLKFRERVVRDPMNALSNWRPKDGVLDHCSWNGVVCNHQGYVVALNLKDMCLDGTLAPELGQLQHIESIVLRNNSFTGVIPTEVADLKQLQVLDLGYNNFTPPLPPNLPINFSLSILLLDNNNLIGSLSPELDQFQMLSQHQVDEDRLRGASPVGSCLTESISWYAGHPNDFFRRSLLQAKPVSKPSPSSSRGNTRRGSTLGTPVRPHPPHSPVSQSPSPAATHLRSHVSHTPFVVPTHSPKHVTRSPSQSPSPAPSPSPSFSPSPSTNLHPPAPAPSVVAGSTPSVTHKSPIASLAPASAHTDRVKESSPASTKAPESKHHKVIVWASISGAFAFLIIAAAGIVICRSNKVVTVKPWATGLSGQLQRAFVSGVPKLKRSELEIACEDFSNIIGSLTDGTVYKGTLSSGVEIAVVASSVKSSEEWSKNLELQYRKKIETLSKVNHKNFVNLIGYCEEEKPFTRMMVFEYAPNGTLFEHLHIKEAERLDWKMRLRIVMGMAYCLEYMHQLDSPIPHRDLQSSAIYLSEDYAAKISDFSFWNEGTRSKMRSPSMQLWEATSTDIESNVFNFGIVLFELVTGRIPYLEDDCTVADWVLDFLEKDQIPREFIDPTLSSFQVEEVQRLFYIIRECIHPDPSERPTMKQVSARLREITEMGPDVACPRLSPLWWAELEILSTEGN